MQPVVDAVLERLQASWFYSGGLSVYQESVYQELAYSVDGGTRSIKRSIKRSMRL